jgi:Golgi phosphoprotein 3 GPP34
MPLLIAEEVLLLAHRADGKCTVGRIELDSALGGALLVELALAGLVDVTDKRVAARDGSAPVEPALAEALARIAERPRRPKVLVRRLARKAKGQLLDGLVARGVLAQERNRVLGVLPGRRYPLVETAVREDIERRLRAAVLEGQRPDQRTAALASIVHAAKMGRRVFPDGNRAAVKRRLEVLSEGEWAADAVRAAIRSAHAATAAAVAAAASANSAGSGG